MPAVIEIKEIPVLSYHLASADMRYIETGVRNIYLREDPDLGLVYRGEIPDCGPACYVGLNEILLEYAMSCEGCKEETTAAEEVSQFGVRLGEILLAKMQLDTLDLATTQKLLKGFEPIFNSMSAVYEIELQEDRLGVSLRCCPLSECAKTTGLGRNVELAYISFTALCTTLIGYLAPDWVLLQPTEGAVQLPLHDIVIVSP
jgi:hypothetical protein